MTNKTIHFQMTKDEAQAVALELRIVIDGTLRSMPNCTYLLGLLSNVLALSDDGQEIVK